ncbi:MAG: hypothetical protein JRJ77_13955 [Deltaproteobacteria bacterium]|nr:hypothetical protein [Deltaproteobacteria bacterium]
MSHPYIGIPVSMDFAQWNRLSQPGIFERYLSMVLIRFFQTTRENLSLITIFGRGEGHFLNS